jgi:hypothetical protein
MGLLDSFFGTPDQTRALGLLGSQMMAGNTPQGFLAANEYLAGAPDRQMKQKLSQMQLQELEQKMQDEQRKRQFMQGLQAPTNPAAAQLYEAAKAGAIPLPDYLKSTMPRQMEFGKIDPKDYTPESLRAAVASGDYTQLVPVRKMEVGPGGQAFNPYSLQPGQVLNDPNKPFMIGQGGQLVPNTPYQQYETGKARAGASQVNVNTDKSYFGNVAEGLAKVDVGAIDAGRSAPDRIASARRVKEVLATNPITGTGAEARLSLNRALATAGLIDGTNVANTEVLASTLASQTLDAIKTSGLGSGQGFTDKDRAFLERAKSGNIEMTPQALGTLADLNERAAVASIRRANSVIGKLRQSPQAGAMGQGLDMIPEPTVPPVVRRQPGQAAPSIDDLVKKYAR